MSKETENLYNNPSKGVNQQFQGEWMHSAVEGAPILFFSISLDGTILNSLGANIKEGNEQQVKGRSIFDLFPQNQVVRKSFERAKKGEQVTSLLETPEQVFLTRFTPD